MQPSGLPDHVADGEDIVRFLTQSGHFNASQPRPAAFLPTPDSQESSVSRHGRNSPDRLLQIGLGAAGARTLHGAAFLTAQAIRACGLDVEADEPPDYHAAIRRWPRDPDPMLQKARQKERAAQLASVAELLVFT